MISIIIPVYNNADTIRGTIDSIRSQSYQDHEVILLHDGSTDDSGSVIKESIGNDLSAMPDKMEEEALYQAMLAKLKKLKTPFFMVLLA